MEKLPRHEYPTPKVLNPKIYKILSSSRHWLHTYIICVSYDLVRPFEFNLRSNGVAPIGFQSDMNKKRIS